VGTWWRPPTPAPQSRGVICRHVVFAGCVHFLGRKPVPFVELSASTTGFFRASSVRVLLLPPDSPQLSRSIYLLLFISLLLLFSYFLPSFSLMPPLHLFLRSFLPIFMFLPTPFHPFFSPCLASFFLAFCGSLFLFPFFQFPPHSLLTLLPSSSSFPFSPPISIVIFLSSFFLDFSEVLSTASFFFQPHRCSS